MNSYSLTNSYLNLPSLFYRECSADHYPDVKLLLFNEALGEELAIPKMNSKERARFFSGQDLLPGSRPVALGYAGFQFGHPVPSLGDGRALLLGELKGFDIQLKGSGQTPFSRRGDGRSALGPVLREYIVSEFMNRVGVPTTRALAAVATGEDVYRQFGPEPGGVFTRVASSHLRVGTFQYAVFNRDLVALEKLLNYAVNRHYPELNSLSAPQKALGLLEKFASKQGELIGMWSALGFIHGVMNTDNCSIDGITIDYGPCAFMEEFEFHKVFSSIDERGRYSYFNQVPIIQWNILRLADTLLPLISSDEDEAVRLVEEKLHPILSDFHFIRMKKIAEKMGIKDYQSTDESLVMDFLNYLQEEKMDFTLSFRNLKLAFSGDISFYHQTKKFQEFMASWRRRVSSVDDLDSINPLFIPRNHLIQRAIDEAYRGDMSFAKKLIEVLGNPYEQREGLEEFKNPAQSHEKVLRTFCGT